MESVHVAEVNSEVLVFLDRNCPTKLVALKEAAKILQREIIRYEADPNRRLDR